MLTIAGTIHLYSPVTQRFCSIVPARVVGIQEQDSSVVGALLRRLQRKLRTSFCIVIPLRRVVAGVSDTSWRMRRPLSAAGT